MIGSHMTLTAGLGLPGQPDRRSVARVAIRTISEGAIGVGPADAVTGLTADRTGGLTFEHGEPVCRAVNRLRMVLARELELPLRERVPSPDGRPGWRGMTASRVLLVLGCVALSAVLRR